MFLKSWQRKWWNSFAMETYGESRCLRKTMRFDLKSASACQKEGHCGTLATQKWGLWNWVWTLTRNPWWIFCRMWSQWRKPRSLPSLFPSSKNYPWFCSPLRFSSNNSLLTSSHFCQVLTLTKGENGASDNYGLEPGTVIRDKNPVTSFITFSTWWKTVSGWHFTKQPEHLLAL